MHFYTYDGSFEGLLTVVFEAYERKEWPTQIGKEGEAPPGIFATHHFVPTQEEKAKRVWDGLGKKLSKTAWENVYKAYLWEQPGFEMLLFQFVRLVFSSTKEGIEENFAEPCVQKMAAVGKQMFREKHRMEAFIRFQRTQDGLYIAPISPDFNVLPLVVPHFEKRYADQPWLIYDVRREYGAYYDLEQVNMVSLEEAPLGLRKGQLSPDILTQVEPFYQQLWQAYFDHVNIPERKNKKLHLRHMPKRYWKYLTEKKPRVQAHQPIQNKQVPTGVMRLNA
ncbi:TIGR03915 family putative DNA repair protein [Rufibacter latericius]|uniref:DNA metabolism protein n=1 Tax=Rufibacter latericius TaxID=2487040 RepID=A0A3M9N3D6_9BACT|nr:TIGR03915 family putative DNA repair protein [Rufibacter latericius]RNI31518.1 DNA metabolism protein [Rufibacter latericius]